MAQRRTRVIGLTLLVLTAAVVVPACNSNSDGEGNDGSSTDSSAPSVSLNGLDDPAAPSTGQLGDERSNRSRLLKRRRRRPSTSPTQEPLEPRLEMPQVIMTQAQQETCLVMTGDAFPQALLRDFEGQPTPLADHFGEKLTVVLFWSGTNAYSVEALQVLAAEVGEPFAEQGVSFVAVHVGETAEEAGQHVEQAGAGVRALFDSDGSFLGQIATEGLPRVYLIDPQGTILWFDIEYSPSTLRQLQTGIRFELAQEGAEAEADTGRETGA